MKYTEDKRNSGKNTYRCMIILRIIHSKQSDVNKKDFISMGTLFDRQFNKVARFSNTCILCMLQTVRSICNRPRVRNCF